MNIIIIGSGPAGISASLYTKRSGIETTVITSGKSALMKANKIENYYGFTGSGSKLYELGMQNALSIGVNIIDDEVVSIEYGDKFSVTTTGGQYFADSIILATGGARPFVSIKGVKELEGKGVSYCAVCDGFFYSGKNVAVIGSGAYAKAEAEHLIPLAQKVYLLTNGEAASTEFSCDVINKKIAYIGGEDFVEGVVFDDGEKIDVQGVFMAVGTADSTALAKKIGIVTDNYKITVNENMETNIPGLFAAGDNTDGMLQIAKAVYEGAKAGTEAVKFVRKKLTEIEK